ncbi:MAG: nickel pincer cofactor biosynthesis protein LarB [Candidatus Eisenbacteria bacterium]|nr:nickel pincer cofactor biosynthesis protein LarB [Candidatus Latescibacterota bacterium]MBD3302461.1 nickel pincer cofactor biosynthesis protein LarB [Candidatus Eisenbacteria bacterium]
MTEEALRKLLEEVRAGALDVGAAVERLRDLPYEDLGYVRIDHHRALRTGVPEVVYCEGKSPQQVAEILSRLAARNTVVLGTRADAEMAAAVQAQIGTARYHDVARMIVVDPDSGAKATVGRPVVVCAAGTSDLPVAEEAAVTAAALGSPVERLWDVGVAGLHRLLPHRAQLTGAGAIVAVAGMEGALPSVVAGLSGGPVIAVPTSVGYGAHFGGISALLTMINSCAPGVCVVNIDNGFGAGYVAHRIAREGRTEATET